MALDERARHELFLRLEQVRGAGSAETLMELLPPVGWADVATKRDLDALEERMNLRFELVDQRFDALEHSCSPPSGANLSGVSLFRALPTSGHRGAHLLAAAGGAAARPVALETPQGPSAPPVAVGPSA